MRKNKVYSIDVETDENFKIRSSVFNGFLNDNTLKKGVI